MIGPTLTLATVATLKASLSDASQQERDRARIVLNGLQHLHHSHLTRNITPETCISCAAMVALYPVREPGR